MEARLAQLESWWAQHRSGKNLAEAPNPEFLARTLIGALDIAREAHCAQKDWEAALRRIDAILEVERVLGRPAEDIAIDQTNRANMLGRLGRFGEAKAELEACLQVFQNDPVRSAMVLGFLAVLFGGQGDLAQAISLNRRALALCEQLPNPSNRAIAHGYLAFHLERSGAPPVLAESARHQLAALVYFIVAGIGQHVQTSLGIYAVAFRRAQAAGTKLAIPRVAELLADPAFLPLEQWLRQRQVNVDELQASVDQFLELARQAASAPPKP